MVIGWPGPGVRAVAATGGTVAGPRCESCFQFGMKLTCSAVPCASALTVAALPGCGGTTTLPEAATIGATPMLVPAQKALVPTINVVTAIGWSGADTPEPAPGMQVAAFARGLDHPRWLYVLPNGDVLVAETNAPARPEDNLGVRGRLFNRYQKKAGGAVPSANRISLLRDADGDGLAESRSALLQDLHSPFGMALVGDVLYVANTDAVVKVPYSLGDTTIDVPPTMVLELPAGPRNHHWTRNIIASPDGRKLYIAIGSNSNVAEHGLDEERGRAELWEFDLTTGTHRTFASGLRNPVGMAWEPIRALCGSRSTSVTSSATTSSPTT